MPPSQEHIVHLTQPLTHISIDRFLGQVDLGAAGVSTQQEPRIALLEASSGNAMFVVLADVHLDRPEVMAQLRKLFEGFYHVCPPLFVFIGNFTSRPLGHVISFLASCALNALDFTR